MQTVTARGRVYNYSHTIGINTLAGRGFRYPVDLALADNGAIYVVNQSDEFQKCQRITIATIDEEYLGEFGGYGEDDGLFVWPVAVALDNDERVYVLDEWLCRVSVYDKDGTFIKKWGKPGNDAGELNSPGGLAFDQDGNVYITEELNHRVQKFTKDGEYISGWGEKGAGRGEFNRPWGITIDSCGDVYVADWHNNRVQKFSPDGEYKATFGTPGSNPGQVKHPSDVAVDADGDVYITDWWNHKLEVYDSEGVHLASFRGDAERLSKWAQEFVDANPDYIKARLRVKNHEPEWRFNRPCAVEISNDGKVLVVDNQRARIQIYQKENGWTDPQFNL